MIRIHLTAKQTAELEKFRHKASSKDAEKALVVLLSADGKSVADISAALIRNPHTVKDWLKRYRRKGLSGLSREYSPGRPDDKRNKVKDRIEEILRHVPSRYGYQDHVWTVPLIAYDIEKNRNISVSTDTGIRALKNLGYSYKRPSKTIPATAPTKEEKLAVIEDIKTLTSSRDSVIHALDEAHFPTEPCPVQGWFEKRWPPWDTDFIKEGKSHILWLSESDNAKNLLEKIPQAKQ